MIEKLLLYFLITHWVADFIFQTDWQAKNKSKNTSALLTHTGIYSLIWFAMLYYITGQLQNAASFMIITFIAHTITDFFTSRLNSYLWGKGQVHNFFVSIGFDQILHYVQLYLTYKLLF